MRDPALTLDIRAQRHTLLSEWYRGPALSDQVQEWLDTVGIHPPRVSFAMEEIVNKPGYVRSFPVLDFKTESEAMAFKLRWL